LLRELEALVVGERQRIFEQLASAIRHKGILPSATLLPTLDLRAAVDK
jgi:hypothetical protein